MVTEFLVIGGPRYHDKRILGSFPTEAEAETFKGILLLEPTDEDLTFEVLKVNPKRIRKRGSFTFLQDVLYFFEQKHTIKEIMEYMYDTLNAMHAFGSETNAWYARESLFYLLKDKEAEDGVDCPVCAIQDKIRELDKSQLQEISDLCMSELDRREENVPSTKMEATQ